MGAFFRLTICLQDTFFFVSILKLDLEDSSGGVGCVFSCMGLLSEHFYLEVLVWSIRLLVFLMLLSNGVVLNFFKLMTFVFNIFEQCLMLLDKNSLRI